MSNLALQASFDAQLAKNRKASEALNTQLNAKKVSQAAEDAADVRTASMVLSAMSKIRVPKDGADGTDGIDGIHGIDGIKGIKGDIGAIGKTGATGKAGTNGGSGKQGYKGNEGVQGKTGPQGIQGEEGLDGINGSNGKPGIDGTDGKDGTCGKDGRNGVDGKDGGKGTDGTSLVNIKSTPLNYVFKLSNGNEFNMPIPIAEKGNEGATGESGKTGERGIDGKQGKDGKNGKDGKTGAQGEQGEDGLGITDITAEGPTLKVKLSNGKTKEVKMPIRGGNGGAPIAPPAVQRASRTPFDPTTNALTSKDVQSAIVETVSLIQQAASGNPYPAASAAGFMFDFDVVNATHSADFVYNGSKQLISTSVVDESSTVLYLVTFTYDGTILESKLISDLSVGDSVDVVFTYTDGLLTKKTLTYYA